jgi:hypothetical protein
MLVLISLTLFPSINIHASCFIGSNAINIEEMSSFIEANPSSSFDQGKHSASSLYRVFALKFLDYVHDCALKCMSSMKP